MNVEYIRCLEHGGSLNNPFAAAGRNEYSQGSRIGGNKYGKAAGGADRQNQFCYSVRNPRADYHPEDNCIEWELDEHSLGGRNGFGDRPDKLVRPPVKK